MTRVLRFHLQRSHTDWTAAKTQSIECRRLFNSINAIARESSAHRFRTDTELPVSEDLDLVEFTTSKPNLGSSYGYEPIRKHVERAQGIDLPQKVAQRVSMAVAASWKSFYGLKKAGHVRARPPRFKQVYGTVEYTKQALSLKALRKDLIIPTGWNHGFSLPDYVSGEQVQAARLIHSHGQTFVLEVVYNETERTRSTPAIKGLAAGIDLGIDSLATITFSDASIRPLRVDGKKVKSFNRFYNKRGASYRSKLDREARDLARKMEVEKISIPSAKLDTLWKKRTRKIDHYLHTASRAVVRAVAEADVETVVIGWNEGFKSGSNMGRRNNQNFVSIPHARFRDMLIYKLEELGIRVILQEESYTSKASFLDEDEIPVYSKGTRSSHSFSGRRITRGQYKSGNGTIVHADVNGAYNILRKSNQSMRLDNGTVVVPQRLSFSC